MEARFLQDLSLPSAEPDDVGHLAPSKARQAAIARSKNGIVVEIAISHDPLEPRFLIVHHVDRMRGRSRQIHMMKESILLEPQFPGHLLQYCAKGRFIIDGGAPFHECEHAW